MKILAVADETSSALWEHFDQSRVSGVDLILSCGDLSPEYLSFLTTVTSVPVLYVHGNHDEGYEQTPPEGCISIEDKIYNFQGIRVLGLGGCMRYREGSFQYTEGQMRARVRRAKLRIALHGGFDILLAHAPAYQLGDGRDLPHQGFRIFRTLMERYQPKVFLHGHVHKSYGPGFRRSDLYQNTWVVNACGRCMIEYDKADRSKIRISAF